jgi:hypothetical protein
MCAGGAIAALLAVGIGVAATGVATAQPDGGTPAPGPVDTAPPVQMSAPTSDNANPAAVGACSQFGDVLDATSTYYGNFADALEENAAPNYSDPYLRDSNTVGRTALRQGAAVAMTTANTPGLPPDIANPMRSWSLDATKLLLKMGLRGGGQTLNDTATEMNNDATAVQQACAAAGTHA